MTERRGLERLAEIYGSRYILTTGTKPRGEILENKKVMEILNKAGKTALRELTCEDVRKAYRSLAMKYHPDKCLEKSDEEKERIVEDFKELGSAYDMLNKYLENMGIVD
ncbi:hypothetical protein AGMMS50222_10800 [Endomicrobiia bacterium]|nr:hypothetical protein AGMMS49556_08940 [Endomicrobiia bacterium]GHT77354.1 hypothetical protein AGMMS50222_10800 [Endomicrobiia bacterium]